MNKCLICNVNIYLEFEFCVNCHRKLEKQFKAEAKTIYEKIKYDKVDLNEAFNYDGLDENHIILKKTIWDNWHYRAFGFSDLSENELNELLESSFIEKYKNQKFIETIKKLQAKNKKTEN